MEFAKESPIFTSNDLYSSSNEISRQYLQWTLVQLVSKGTVSRVKRGMYTLAEKPSFSYQVNEDTKQLYTFLKKSFPNAPLCVYDGKILSPLQHHLSYNALTYVETERSIAEIIFHTLQEKSYRVFYKPGKDEFYKYIDISSPAIIVKPMVSDSPLKTMDGIIGPTLEKLMVDIRRDKDFDYLSGKESARMLENAFKIFSINITKLLRYAGRRGVRDELAKEIDGLSHGK
ncbi:MAG: type IV toxin-antitoxin system AbiEi family antitoxin domain-containing protein [Bacteroidales bacterium]|nr:type IV toxin-antitoxin system AbiEi family antitoxin domain-containing protein [Bacteroidales bacterium]